jgi:hypothetical protein
MTENMKGLLLEDRWAPVTSELGFLETDAEHAVRAFATWHAGLLAPRGIEYLRHLGLSPFEEDFYLPQGAPAWLVERKGPVAPNYEEFTLAQAREEF